MRFNWNKITILIMLIFSGLAFYSFNKKNENVYSSENLLLNQKIIIEHLQNSKKRLKVSDITLLGQGDRALILNIDEKDYLFILSN